MIYRGKTSDYYDAVGYLYGSYNNPPILERDPMDAGSYDFYYDESSVEAPYRQPITCPDIGFKKRMLSFDFGTVGFCGKIYNHVRVRQLRSKSSNSINSSKYEVAEEYYFYTIEDFLEHVELLELKHRELKDLAARFHGQLGGLGWHTVDKLEKVVKNYFERVKIPEKYAYEFSSVPYWFYGYNNHDVISHKSPLAHGAATLMPNLKQLEFDQVMPAEQAYQELEMYLARDNQEESDPNSGIADEYIAAGKGFDCMSFKTRGPNSSCPTKRRK